MSTAFDKPALRVPSQAEGVYLSHCGISPLYPGAADAAREWDALHCRHGVGVFQRLADPLGRVRRAAASLMQVSEADVAFLRNTAEGLSMVANGLPLQPGDRVVSYIHEYPSNHYPWRLQEMRGAKLELLPDRPCGSGLPEGRPRGFELDDLEKLLSAGGVRAVAVSHVQFTSGFTADLAAMGRLCHEHGAWLIVDAAQSLGVLPVHPARCGADAVAASGWKWLLGPVGTGLLYTSARLRAELRCTMAGADMMQQGDEYLNHTWKPLTDARIFEYSTGSISLAAGLAACVEDLPGRHGVEAMAAEAARLRELIADGLDRKLFQPVRFPGQAGPILSWKVNRPETVAKLAQREHVTVTVRGGYLRTAPHFYQTDQEMARAVEVLNDVARRA